jgi:hypothetical protein
MSTDKSWTPSVSWWLFFTHCLLRVTNSQQRHGVEEVEEVENS